MFLFDTADFIYLLFEGSVDFVEPFFLEVCHRIGHRLTFVEMNEENGQEERCREYRRPKHGQDLP